MSDGRVEVTLEGGVGTVSFFHPKKNSLPGSLLDELARSITALGADDGCGVILLRSEGDGPFCAGASFDEFIAVQSEADGEAFFRGFATVILAMVRAPKFVVGRVHGKAVGGGVGLISACDYALATREASVRLSEYALGFGPFIIGPAVEHRIGRSAFAALTIDTTWRDAEWAASNGLFASVHDDAAALDEALDALLGRLSSAHADATGELKRVMWAGTEGWESELPGRVAITSRLVLSEHVQHALAQFKSGRRD